MTQRNINILLVGECGVGKSTLINAFANYLEYGEFDVAEKNKVRCVIPSYFTITDDDFEDHIIKIINQDGKNVNCDSESATQETQSYEFAVNRKGIGIIRFIDTPGLGNVQGIDYDEKNLRNTLEYIQQYEKIHAVCFLLKPNNVRSTIMFQYCIQKLLSKLDKDTIENMMFLFTNTRGTFYKPGDTIVALKEALEIIKDKPPFLDISVTFENMYCFDNEAFRYLATAENGIQLDGKQCYAESWRHSIKESLRLIDTVIARENFNVPLSSHQLTLPSNETHRSIQDVPQRPFKEPESKQILPSFSNQKRVNTSSSQPKKLKTKNEISNQNVFDSILDQPIESNFVANSITINSFKSEKFPLDDAQYINRNISDSGHDRQIESNSTHQLTKYFENDESIGTDFSLLDLPNDMAHENRWNPNEELLQLNELLGGARSSRNESGQFTQWDMSSSKVDQPVQLYYGDRINVNTKQTKKDVLNEEYTNQNISAITDSTNDIHKRKINSLQAKRITSTDRSSIGDLINTNASHYNHHGVYTQPTVPENTLVARQNTQSYTNKNEVRNILLLGEHGTGKSTFVNAFANYLKYGTFDIAKASELLCLVPAKFTTFDENYEENIIEINNNTDIKQQDFISPEPHSYKFQINKNGISTVNFIDTPGIGDTGGIIQDNENLENTLEHINQYERIHAICVLLKANNGNKNGMYEHCLKQILSRLGKKASNNIMFIFTCARSTFFDIGDSATSLKSILTSIKSKPPHVEIPFRKTNVFCMDNEAFRYLAAKKIGVELGNEEHFKESWNKSIKECWRLMDTIADERNGIKPLKVKDIMSINEARLVIIQLSEPIVDVIGLIHDNIQALEEHLVTLNIRVKSTNDLKENFYIPLIYLQIDELNCPALICTSAKCRQSYKVLGNDKHFYQQICATPCYLKNRKYGIQELTDCEVMKNNKCQKCSCPSKMHTNTFYRLKSCTKKQRNEEMKQKINENNRTEFRIKLSKIIEETIVEYRNEMNILIKTIAKLGFFLEHNTIVPYTDYFTEYVQHLIDRDGLERESSDNQPQWKKYDELLRRYREEKSRSSKESSTIVLDSIPRLYQLPITGSDIQKLHSLFIQKQNTANVDTDEISNSKTNEYNLEDKCKNGLDDRQENFEKVTEKPGLPGPPMRIASKNNQISTNKQNYMKENSSLPEKMVDGFILVNMEYSENTGNSENKIFNSMLTTYSHHNNHSLANSTHSKFKIPYKENNQESTATKFSAENNSIYNTSKPKSNNDNLQISTENSCRNKNMTSHQPVNNPDANQYLLQNDRHYNEYTGSNINNNNFGSQSQTQSNSSWFIPVPDPPLQRHSRRKVHLCCIML